MEDQYIKMLIQSNLLLISLLASDMGVRNGLLTINDFSNSLKTILDASSLISNEIDKPE